MDIKSGQAAKIERYLVRENDTLMRFLLNRNSMFLDKNSA